MNKIIINLRMSLSVLLFVCVVCLLSFESCILYYLYQSIQHTQSLNCNVSNNFMVDNLKNLQTTQYQNSFDIHSHIHYNLNSKQTKINNFPNLLKSSSLAKYDTLPYLPHNIQYINYNSLFPNGKEFQEYITHHPFKTSHKRNDGILKHMKGISSAAQMKVSPNSYNTQYYHRQPNVFLTIEDELKRNDMITNEELWNIALESENKKKSDLSESQMPSFPKKSVIGTGESESYDSDSNSLADISFVTDTESVTDQTLDIYCDFTIESLFNHSIHKLYGMKGRNFMESMTCPTISHLGWRHVHYIPFMFGNHCEPWWSRDAVFVISQILNKEMIGIEYGSGTSTIWLSMMLGFLISSEHNPQWVKKIENTTKFMNIENLKLIYNNLGRRYVEMDYAQAFPRMEADEDVNNDEYIGDIEKIFDSKMEQNLRNYEFRKGNIDMFAIDGRLRKPCTEYALQWIKKQGGILLFDNSDRENVGFDGLQSLKLIPDHWLRFDSSHWNQHKNVLKDQKWLKNSRTTIWITRDERCLKYL